LSTYSDKKSCHTSTTLQTSTRGLSAIAELLVTRANETNGYSDYDAVAFIVTTMEKRPSYMRALAVRADVTRRSE